MNERVLVTGDAGYFGSRAWKALARACMLPVACDELRRGNRRPVRWGQPIEARLEGRYALVAAKGEDRRATAMDLAANAYVCEAIGAPSGLRPKG